MCRVIVLSVISLLIGACTNKMEYVPAGADLQATNVCSTKGGVEQYAAYGDVSYPTLAKLRITCKDGSKWAEEYSTSQINAIQEQADLRYQNRKLERDLAEAQRAAAACSSTDGDSK